MTNGPGPSLPRGAPLASGLVLSAIVATLLVSAVVLWRFHRATDDHSGLSERFELNLEPYMQVDPALVEYQQTSAIPVGLATVRAIAVGPADRMYVAGDRAVAIFDAGGQRVQQLAVEGEPSCVAVAGAESTDAGSVYVGVDNRIDRFGPNGQGRAAWTQGFNDDTVLTSLAVGDEDVFAADAGNRVVWRINQRGEPIGKIGDASADGAVGFTIPSGYFDVAVTADGLLRVANPAARRIETFTFDGHRLGQWGQSSADIEGFFGCCNPANFAVLPDGRFVTVEKGIPRVKVYSREGKFDCVVAAPRTLTPTATAAEETREEHQVKVFDVAADSRGRVLVLDPTAKTIRVFERKS